MQIEIKNVYGKTLYIAEISDDTPAWRRTRDAVQQAVSSDADLSDADLSGADLSDADLSGADLSDADLSDANLSRANLSRANLSRADLSGANLTDADLTDADLRRADLRGADLSRADLSRANLSRANLRSIKADLWMTLTQNRHEVQGLRAALVAGEIDGTQYSGSCACLVGTLANVRGCDFSELDHGAEHPAERWFLNIKPGHTPYTSAVAALTLKWIDEWLVLNELTKAISATS